MVTKLTRLVFVLLCFATLSSGVFAQTPEMIEQSERIEEERARILEEYEAAKERIEESNQEINEEADRMEEVFESNLDTMERGSSTMNTAFDIFQFGRILTLALVVVAGIAVLLGIIFDILMIIDCFKREFKDKNMWLIILIVGGVIGLGLPAALVYFFVVKKKLDAGVII